jgi:beta-N-acetylhexosaminidase
MPQPTNTPAALSIDDLISGMTIEDKVGQLMIIGFDGTALTDELREMIAGHRVGGIIYYERNVESPQTVAHLNADLQTVARSSGQPGLFITIDQEGGVVTRLRESKGFTEFPGAMGIAATGDIDNAHLIASALAHELRALGFNMDLAPDLDVNNNPANPIIGARSFGSDPQRVAQFGVAFIESLQGEGIMAIGKHFPGHGDTGIDSHLALPTIRYDRSRLDTVEFVPFQAAMKANIVGIMSAHITFPAIDPTPGLAATLSPKVLTGLLRDELKFNGLIMTDELGMGALTTSGYPAPVAAATSLKAGADVLLFNHGFELHKQSIRMIVDWVQRGIIPQSRLDQAVRRVLETKAKYALLTPAVIRMDSLLQTVGTSENKEVSRKIALESITMLRDDEHLIPLGRDAKLLVVETIPNIDLGKALGATTISVRAQPSQSDIDSVMQVARDKRVVIVGASDMVRNNQQAVLVNSLLKANNPTIVVSLRTPYDQLAVPNVATLIAAYGSNPPVIDALVEVLLGRAKAGGKLPVELK